MTGARWIILLSGFALIALLSYGLAAAGEPSSVWLWNYLL